MKTAFFAYPSSPANPHGVMDPYIVAISNGLEKRGWSIIRSTPKEPDFIKKMLSVGEQTENLIFLGAFFYDLRLNASYELNQIPLSELVKCRVFGSVGDHPFVNFMSDRIKMCDPKAILLLTDMQMSIALNLLDCPSKSFKEYRMYPTLKVESPKKFHEREIDLLLPISFHSNMPRIQVILNQCHDEISKQIVTECYEELLICTTIYPLMLFNNIVQKRTGKSFSDFKKTNFQVFSWLLNIMGFVDYAVRSERRLKILKKLKSDPNFKNIYITDKQPDIVVSENVRFIGNQSFQNIIELTQNSKFLAQANPTYPNSVHERIINSIEMGAVVVTDTNKKIKTIFQSPEDMVFLNSDYDIIESINACGPRNWDETVQSAKQKNNLYFSLDNMLNILESE